MVIQQVEKNLIKTTERALESEKTCEALTHELNEAKLKIKYLNKENGVLKSSLLSSSQDVRNDIGGIVAQLNSASDTAEKSLTSLMSGVETLRFISVCLESVGKIKQVD